MLKKELKVVFKTPSGGTARSSSGIVDEFGQQLTTSSLSIEMKNVLVLTGLDKALAKASEGFQWGVFFFTVGIFLWTLIFGKTLNYMFTMVDKIQYFTFMSFMAIQWHPQPIAL